MNFGIPDKCPVCGGKLEILESKDGIKNLFCTNPNCSCRTNETMTAFMEKLGVMGVSNATLSDWNIHTLDDLINFVPDPARKNEVKFTKELGNKLWKCPPRKLFLAMSAFVYGIGEKEMDKFDEKFHLLETNFACPPQVSSYVKEQAIIENLDTIISNYRRIVNDPRFAGVDEVKETSDDSMGTICFTGKLETMTRSAAQAKAKELGYKIADSVSKDLGTLVVADAGLQGAPSSKLKKARSLGICIMSETEFNNL